MKFRLGYVWVFVAVCWVGYAGLWGKASGERTAHLPAEVSTRVEESEAVDLQCAATTRKGTRCLRRATDGEYCWQHVTTGQTAKRVVLAPSAQCAAVTREGMRCSRRVTEGEFCWQHQRKRVPAKATTQASQRLLSTPGADNLLLGVPGPADYLIDREGYAVGYDITHKQPRWVTYRLTRAEAEAVTVSRKVADFQEDAVLPKGGALLADYRRSGYDRGHLACAGDMRQSRKRMQESFLLSNVSPMNREFNGGVWSKLEEQVRTWAKTYGEVQVVTGPVLTVNAELPTIGTNAVTVPPSFYKVVYASQPQAKAIGFIIPNQPSSESFKIYVRSVDEVETVTGLDFFSALPDDLEKTIEKHYEPSEWNL